MIGAQYQEKGTIPEPRNHRVKLTGAGASAPTVLWGRGFSVTRAGAGDYKLTWSEYVGNYVGVDGYSFEANTPLQLAGFTLVIVPIVAATRLLEFVIYNASQVATDLAANQWLTLNVLFAETKVT